MLLVAADDLVEQCPGAVPESIVNIVFFFSVLTDHGAL